MKDGWRNWIPLRWKAAWPRHPHQIVCQCQGHRARDEVNSPSQTMRQRKRDDISANNIYGTTYPSRFPNLAPRKSPAGRLGAKKKLNWHFRFFPRRCKCNYGESSALSHFTIWENSYCKSIFFGRNENNVKALVEKQARPVIKHHAVVELYSSDPMGNREWLGTFAVREPFLAAILKAERWEFHGLHRDL